MDEAIKEQESLGIIEKIPNLEHYLTEHPEHSFLPHMGVFKLDRDTTKCRVVFLSNICEADPRKPMTIALRPSDQNKLLFLWVRSVKKKDFSLVGYKNLRLSFGLRCSPTILMLSLYKILVLDVDDDTLEVKNMKKLLYQLFYMDNGAYTCEHSDTLKWAYTMLTDIFAPYRIELQQIVTNDGPLQEVIDSGLDQETLTEVKLLGLKWNRELDTLSTFPIVLETSASTKRSILRSIASNFDLYNINGPVFNRARLFMHGLQCDKSLGWDDILPAEKLKEWKCICKAS
ncbi:uncharacterized protein [Macrobrachium rosenbergii]|uniref:uncharacterized protein n=1 Tax=Macrobrachium rosenbergii TaxID=79674 RepID=UPI0034D76E71